MNALWLENQTLSFRSDIPVPVPGPGEALVRVRLAGICSTDLELVRGYYPYTGIIGHEFVGEVVQAEDDLWVGMRVVGEINAVCGECAACRAGRPTHCEQRNVLGIHARHGAFAEYLTLPLENLHPVPDAIPDGAAVFVEPLAAALEILQQVHIRPTDRVLVLGAGRLGQLVAQVLALTGCDLRVVARHPQQRQLLTAQHISALAIHDVPPRSMDVVIDATGTPDGFAQARQALRPRGTLVMKSTYAGQLTADFSSMVVDEITLVGSRCGPFAPALRLLASGRVSVLPLIAGRYALKDGLLAMQQAAQAGTMKILLIPGDTYSA
jgi:2-desacetyl-2-hydroxyethyl bacteriochlorophyllide A dehydrogenase